MILPLVHYGDQRLRKKCAEVKDITPEICQLVQDMIETMDAAHGIGLAAPQVGYLIRLFVLRNYIIQEGKETTLSEPYVFINPKITHRSYELCADTEGCLSIPGIREEVERPVEITIEALDIKGEKFSEVTTGINARVRMHENDHINGVLFIDRIAPIRKKKIASLLKQLERKYALGQ